LGIAVSDRALRIFAASPSEPVAGYSFAPRAELLTRNALIFLWVLENKVAFIGPVRDPWFQALREDLNGNSTVWRSGKAAGVMGCTEQHEFCNTTSCLAPLSMPVHVEDFSDIAALRYNEKQMATFRYMHKAALYGRAYVPAMLLQDELLLARPQVFQDPIFGGSGISLALPDNQWELEVDHLFNTSLAFLQHMAVEHASQSNVRIESNRSLWDFVLRDNYTGADDICHSQMIRSTAFTSLSVVGLACILGIGGAFILLSVALPHIVPWVYLQIWKSGWCRQQLEWQGNDVLMLLRTALESLGAIGRASGRDGLVPPEKDKPFDLPWMSGGSQPDLELGESATELRVR
jgi:hypothetical protein